MYNIPAHPRRDYNEDRLRPGEMPCCVCGKGIKRDNWKYSVHLFWGATVVTEAEAAELYAKGDGNGDMSFYPLGAECYRNLPEIRPYAQKQKKEE
jgi:hypothetical protein